MKVSEYIRDLLLFHDKLTVPGLGTFEILRESASIKGRKISPPKSFVVFNPNIPVDDMTLTLKIAAAEEIAYEEAEKYVLNFSKKIQNILEKNKVVSIKGLGILQRDKENKYIFFTDEKLKLDFEVSGFDSFELDLLDDQLDEKKGSEADEQKQHVETEQQETKIEINNNVSTVNQIAHEEEEKQTQLEKQTYKYESFPPEYELAAEKKTNRNFIRILIASLVIIFISIIVVALTTDLFDSLNFAFLNKSFKSSGSSLISKDQGRNNKSTESAIDSLTRIENALRLEEEIPVLPSYSEYHIIAGSFSLMENADELQKELSLLGYPSLIINRGDGFYRVSASSFKDREEALQQLEVFKEKTVYKSAWVLGLKGSI